jgi:predicted type IV restriction endonuclease
MAMPKRVADRIKSGLRTFKRVLADAQAADRSEQDTVTIVTDMLADVFGYDKYAELTGEYAIRGTFCDLAVKVDDKIRYLVEVKAVDKSLKENHLRQATDYAAKEGIEWVVLTNGIEWQAYRMIFEQPVRFEHVFTIDVLAGNAELTEMVYMLSREGIVKSALDEYHEQRQILNRHMVAAVVLSEPVIKVVRRELRAMASKMKIDVDEVQQILSKEVMKRDVVEADELKSARRKVARSTRRSSKSESASVRQPVAKAEPAREPAQS